MNWYKKAQAVAELPTVDLSLITPQQWQEINDRMVAKGYDRRGWEDTKRIYERLQNTPGGLEGDHQEILDAVTGEKEYIPLQDPKKNRNAFNRAIRYFGTTFDIRECGYILPNGTMLDLSGKKHGGPSGKRGLDHGEINSINLNAREFGLIGGIRHFPETPGVDIKKEPTPKQLAIIQYDADNSGRGYTVEVMDPRKGRFYKTYDTGTKGTKIISDIQKFYGKNWYLT
jgi:hypothetical protein